MGRSASQSSTVHNGNRSYSVIELRQYTLQAGKRDTLIDLFDREFVESQEVHGTLIIGQFRDLGDPDRFVWLRGFEDMPSRPTALQRFYGGPVWRRHSAAANATMIDSDNVLLLRPVQTAFDARQSRSPRERDAPPGTKDLAARLESLPPGGKPALGVMSQHLRLSATSRSLLR